MNGTYALILGHVALKLLTFGLNQALISSVDPPTLGLATFLEFITNLILFFSREAVRLSTQRTSSSGVSAEQSVINFGYVPVILSIPLSCLALLWNWPSRTFQEEFLPLPALTLSLVILAVSLALELSVEPLYELNQYHMNLGNKARIESLGILCRGVVTVLLLKRKPLNSSLLAFMCGQLAYSFVQFIGYLKVNVPPGVSCLAQRLPSGGWLDKQVVQVWKALFVQMIFKQVLTEGDKLVINHFFPLSTQAVYAVMLNYGLILARLVFLPIEESSRVWFTKVMATMSDKSDQRRVISALKSIEALCVGYLHFTVLLLMAGIPNAAYVLRLVLRGAAAKWDGTDLFTSFGKYVWYLALLAFNGIFEALFTSVATTKELKYYSYFMTSLCIVFFLVLKLAIEHWHLELSGLILANAVNMSMRIFWCSYHLHNTFVRRFGIHIDKIRVLTYIAKCALLFIVGNGVQQYINGTTTTTTFRQFFNSGVICGISLLVQIFWEYPRIRSYVKRKKE